MKKRLLSALLTLCMVFTLMPVSAFAESIDGSTLPGITTEKSTTEDEDTAVEGRSALPGTATEQVNPQADAPATYTVTVKLPKYEESELMKVVEGSEGVLEQKITSADEFKPVTVAFVDGTAVEEAYVQQLNKALENTGLTASIVEGSGNIKISGSPALTGEVTTIDLTKAFVAEAVPASAEGTGDTANAALNGSGSGGETEKIKETEKTEETEETENSDDPAPTVYTVTITLPEEGVALKEGALTQSVNAGNAIEDICLASAYDDEPFESDMAGILNERLFEGTGLTASCDDNGVITISGTPIKDVTVALADAFEDEPTNIADDHTHCVCGESNCTSHGGATVWTAWDGTSDITYINSVASVYLTDSITPSSSIEVTDGKTLNLCLNGKTLTKSITVKSGTLNICDCKGSGGITMESGSAIYVTTVNKSNFHTTLNLYGGKISSNSTSDSGTIKLYNNDSNNAQTVAVFNIYGGEVYNGYAGESAVYASYANIGTGYYSINMYGGSVTCEKGYGFKFNNNKNVTMQVVGGTITSGYYGVDLCSDNMLTLSGNPQFIDGKYNNSYAGIYLQKNTSFIVNNDFTGSASVRQALGETVKGVIAKPAAGGSSLSDKAQYFTSAEEGYFVECKDDGNLQLSTCKITQQPTADNNYTVTANGSADKVKYQWYSTSAGTVAVTDKNATKGSSSSYNNSWDEWSAAVCLESSANVTWDAFTLPMSAGDKLTVKYQDRSYDGGSSIGSFSNFELTGSGSTVTGVVGSESYYTTYTFTAPADGEYTLKVTATPGSYTSGGATYYTLYCNFSATVSADVAGEALSDQTAAALNTEGRDGKYLCAVTWEDKTTLYSNAVDLSTQPAAHTHPICGSTCTDTAHTDLTWQAISSLDQITKAGNYYLTDSVNLTNTWTCQYTDVNLCLNGHTITGASGADVITNNGSLAITDCQTTVGKITHAAGAKGRGITNDGTLTLWNGSITGNIDAVYGGGVHNKSSGTFNMYNGSITQNTSSSAGGGVHNDGGTFNMYGGSIADNTTTTNGGGVKNTGIFTMSGGSITGNTAADSSYGNGGGVYNDGTLNMSGTPKVSGNTLGSTTVTVNNVYLPSGKTVTVESGESLSAGASVGISGTLNQTVVSDTTDTIGFFSDNTDYELVDDGSNGLKLAERTVTIDGVTLRNSADGGTAMTGSTKVYDGKAVAYSGGTYMPSVSGELKYTWQKKAADSETYSSLTDAPKDAGSYRLHVAFVRGSSELSTKDYDFTINAKELTVTATAKSKIYDGKTDATVESIGLTGVVEGDKVSLNQNGMTAAFENASAGTGKTVTVSGLTLDNNEKGNYTLPKSVTCKANITKASGSGSVMLDGWIYGETAKTPVPTSSTNGTDNVTYQYRAKNAAETDQWQDTAPKNAGEYTVKATFPESDNYKEVTATYNFTISPKELTVNATAQSKTYDGTTAATVNAVLNKEGVIDGDVVELVTTGVTAAFDTKEVGTNKSVTLTGSYTLSGDAASNYTLIQPTNITASITAYNSDGTEYTVNSTGEWLKTDFKVTAAEGWQVSRTNTATGEWVDKITVSQENNDGTLEFYLRNKNTGVISEKVTKTYKIDKTEPAGKIEIDTNIWTKFLETITFGLYYNNQQTVTITAEDGGSGVASIEYLTTDDNLAITDLETKTFTAYANAFSIDPDAKLIVYARLTDKAGNVNYLRSDGVVLDATAPVINGADNGGTYCAAVTLTITDDYLDTVTVNDSAVTVTGNTMTLTLDPATGTQTVVATDKAKNSTTLTVTVNDGHTWGAWSSNGDGTHTRTCKFDAAHTETGSCSGGTATCTAKAVCTVCGAGYGAVNPNNHSNLTHVPYKAATAYSTGNIEYWYCSGCGKYFLDAKATNAIAQPLTVIPRIYSGWGGIRTGDESNLALWLTLLLLSGAGAAAAVLAGRKRKRYR